MSAPPVAAAVYQSAFDSSPVGEYLLSPSDDPVVMAVNNTFLKACGRSRESLVGQRLFAAFPGNPDDPRDTGVGALRSSLAQVIATGQPQALPLQRYPIRVTQDDGTEVFQERYWHAVNSPIFDSTGQLVCIAHRTEDVTAQTAVAETLAHSTDRLTFQLSLSDQIRCCTTPDAIATTASRMLGEKMRIVRVTYVEVDESGTSFVQRHWVHGEQAGPASPPERRRLEEFGPEIVATLKRGEPLVIRDVVTDARTGRYAAAYASIGVRSNLAIPLIKAGKLTIVLSLQHDEPRDWSQAEIDLAVDVAERMWASAENAKAQEELRIANQRKDEFLAMLAHELRNPLAPIRLAAELLARGSLDEARLKRTSDIIARQVKHMSGLVDDLLDVSRVTRGMVTLEEAPLDMKTVLSHAAEQVRPLMESFRHHLTLDLPPDAAIVCGDSKRLIQVMSNLLNNSARFTPTGGHVHASLKVEGDQVLARVKDDGIGIPRHLQSHVFELFAQASRTPDRSQGGLGLGLALVKSLVERHHGSVSLVSDGPGTGSCFTVSLPLLRSGKNDRVSEPQHETPEHLRPVDVLVVDDNIDAADLLGALLEDAGHRVRVEHHPESALKAARQAPPEFGLIDIGLPTMSGYDLVRLLRADPATTGGRYVALTGYGQPSDRQQALEAGFDDHMVKPVDPKTLFDLMRALVGSRAA